MEKTHNLEVINSSPIWSTNRIKSFTHHRKALFVYNQVVIRINYDDANDSFEINATFFSLILLHT